MKLWFSVEKDFFGMEYIDADNEQMFLGAATPLIPFNTILRRDRTLMEKNWGVECRLRTKWHDRVLDFLLMMGAAIPPVNGRILSHSPQAQKGVSVWTQSPEIIWIDEDSQIDLYSGTPERDRIFIVVSMQLNKFNF